jgi:hypothetical protein
MAHGVCPPANGGLVQYRAIEYQPGKILIGNRADYGYPTADRASYDFHPRCVARTKVG